MSNGDSTDQTSTDQTGADQTGPGAVEAPARQRAPRRRAATRPSGPPGAEAPAATAVGEGPATGTAAVEDPAPAAQAPPAEPAAAEVAAPARRAPRRRAASRPAGAPGPDAAEQAPAAEPAPVVEEEAVVTASEPLVVDEPAVVVEDVDVPVEAAPEVTQAPEVAEPAAAVGSEAPAAERTPRRSGSRRAASRPAGPPQPVDDEAPAVAAATAPAVAPSRVAAPVSAPVVAPAVDTPAAESPAEQAPAAEEPTTGRGRGGRRSRAAGAPAGAPAVRPVAEPVVRPAVEVPQAPAVRVEAAPDTTPRTPDASPATDDASADDSRTRRPARGRGARTSGRPADAPSGRVELGSGALAGPSRPAARSPQFDDGDADLIDADPGDLPESAVDETPRGRRGGRGRSRRAGSPATEPQTSEDRETSEGRAAEVAEDAASASTGSGDPRADGLGVDLAAELGQLRRRRPAAGAAEGATRSVDDLVRFDADDSDDADDTGSDRGDDDDQGEDDEDGARARRSRRRRGGRGRRRRTPGEDAEGADGAEGSDGADGAEGDEDDDEDEPTATGEHDDATSEDGSTDDAAPGDEDEDDDEDHAGTGADDGGEGGSRRRRRRRRRSGSDAAGESEDGEAAEEDASGETGDDDGSRRRGRGAARTPARGTGVEDVTAIKGSTRLEAKRQRRRDGRESGRRPKIISEAEFLARREAVERTMVVRSRAGRTQIAVLEDDVLVEHYVARKQHGSMIGNVYLGKVQNVLPSMEAAFVDIGRGRNAVLYAGEVNWEAAGLSGQAKRIESALKSGDPVLVQVSKDPVGHKGARLTSQVSLPGRYLVYVPGGSMTGISRKLPDTERARLKKILREVVPEDGGVIVRTAAEGASEVELRRDVERLVEQWEEITARAKRVSPPVLLHGEPDLTIKVVRDVFNEDFASLVVDGDDAWDAIAPYIEQVAPDLADRVERWDDPRDAFAAHRIDEQIAKALERKVWLPSGGSLVIDRTEAMTVVDVNTGRFTGSGGNLEETVTKNNLEAAEEIVRQLRLRDIGGIVVVDFIDMVLESNRDLVLRRLVECLGRDRTKHQVAEVTSLGLVQMTRKRVGQGLLEAFSESCEHCHGRGVVLRDEPVEIVEEVEPEGGRGRRGGRSSADAEPLLARDPSAVPAGSSASSSAAVPEPRDAVEKARQDAARDAVAHAIHGVALASKLVAPHHDDHAHDAPVHDDPAHDDDARGGAAHEPAHLEAATVAVAQVAAEAAAEVGADAAGPTSETPAEVTADEPVEAPVEAPVDAPAEASHDAPGTPDAPQDGEAV